VSGPVFDATFRKQLGDLFQWRRDVRRFRTDAVPTEVLARLLVTANGAPSVGLSQPWRFVTVDDPARRAAIRANFSAANAAALAEQSDDRAAVYARLKLAGLDEAPVHLAVCVDPDPSQGGGLGRATQPETIAYSAVLAIHTLWLAARAEGVGVGWVSILDPVAAMRTLDLPPEWRLVAYLCIGYPQAVADVPELELSGWQVRQPVELLRR
jgi:5,6-dimethylbenzimidazole synthase